MLHDYEVDSGVPHVRLQHSTDREAVDGAMREVAADLGGLLEGLGPGAYWTRDALKAWRAVGGGLDGQPIEAAGMEEAVRLSWGSSVIGRAAREDVSKTSELALEMARRAPDPWALCEITYETTRLWPIFSGDRGFINAYRDTLIARPLGLFALLEPLLFWHEAAAHPLWAKVGIGIDELQDSERPDRDFVVGLVFDSLLWRRPAIDPGELNRHLTTLLELGAGEGNPIAGAFAFAAVYHYDNLDLLSRPSRQALARMEVRTPEQAEAASCLFRFHYMHECRNRALLPRRDYDESIRRYLAHRSRDPDPELDQGPAMRLFRDMARFPEQRGWALHAALNYGIVHGRLPDEFLGELVVEPWNDADDGVISAVLACDLPRVLLKPLREYFAKPANRTALLDRMADGFEIDGTVVARPRFQFARKVQDVFDQLEVDWPQLERRGLPGRDHPRLVRELRAAAASLATDGTPLRWATERVVRRVDYGDLRELVGSLPARGTPQSALAQALEVAARALVEKEKKLF